MKGPAGEVESFDHAASVYELSTSAVMRKRHLLVRKVPGLAREHGYRVSTIERKLKGKASLLNGTITFSHTREEGTAGREVAGFLQVFRPGVMEASYPGAFRDVWSKVSGE